MRRLAAFALLAASLTWAQEGNERAALLAKDNAQAQRALKLIREKVATIKSPTLRATVLSLLDAPRPTFLTRFADAPARDAVRLALVKEGLLEASVTLEQLFPPLPVTGPVQCFACSPGNPPGKHHGYPGGLAEHTAFNLQSALALEQQYRAQLEITALDHDVLVASSVLHDLLKTWTLQWQADGTTLTQPKVGGTASHHVFIVAEALFRKLDPSLVIALAAAHEPNGAPLISFLRSAAILAGVDPVEAGVLVRDSNGLAQREVVLPEAAINHLSDHDYVLVDPAEGALREALGRLLSARVTEKKVVATDAELRWEMHRIETHAPGLKLYFALVHGGDAALATELHRLKVTLLP
jgi:hypothetical protein